MIKILNKEKSLGKIKYFIDGSVKNGDIDDNSSEEEIYDDYLIT